MLIFFSWQDFDPAILISEKEIVLLNKFELTQKLKDKSNLTGQEASDLVELFFSEMTKAFIAGERIEIRGLCSFFIKKYEGYTGRNPKTGKKVKVVSKKLPFFKCGKELKERVDYPALLEICCKRQEIKLNHHEALSDARGCAMLYLKSGVLG
jgi:integration host factor subunit beta